PGVGPPGDSGVVPQQIEGDDALRAKPQTPEPIAISPASGTQIQEPRRGRVNALRAQQTADALPLRFEEETGGIAAPDSAVVGVRGIGAVDALDPAALSPLFFDGVRRLVAGVIHPPACGRLTRRCG